MLTTLGCSDSNSNFYLDLSDSKGGPPPHWRLLPQQATALFHWGWKKLMLRLSSEKPLKRPPPQHQWQSSSLTMLGLEDGIPLRVLCGQQAKEVLVGKVLVDAEGHG